MKRLDGAAAARPWVSLNAAMTLDGRIAAADRRKFTLSSREDRRRMAALRDDIDAVIIGAGTLRSEDPPPFVREQKRPGRGREAPFTWVIVTRSLDIPPASRILRSRQVRVVVAAPETSRAGADPDLGRRAEIWRIGREQVDLPALLGRLAAGGARRVVVEGGGKTNFAFLEAGLVDELFVTLCPFILGGAGAPTLADGAGYGHGPMRLELLGLERQAEEIFLHYRCRKGG
jgi:riboflavin-specific deaminase-like protein